MLFPPDSESNDRSASTVKKKIGTNLYVFLFSITLVQNYVVYINNSKQNIILFYDSTKLT